MARATQRSTPVEAVRPYLEGVAKNLADKLYGPNGPPWGTKLTQIEDLLLELREVLTEEMLAQVLARQTLPDPAALPPTCPGCQQPLTCSQHQPRRLRTRVGEAEWSEPEGYCPKCRQAFFPAGAKPGHRPQCAQPGRAATGRLCRHGGPFVRRSQRPPPASG
jgi:hypothetical protein